jgi:hypothetical protein
MGDIEVGGVEKPAAIWEDTYYTFIIIKMAASLAPPTVTSLRSFDTTTNFGASSPIFSP